MDKVIKLKNFNKIINRIKGKKTILVGGCFDIFHYGHLVFLKKAKSLGDYLIIALESDKFIEKKKGRQPIHNQKQRAEILASLKMIDLIITLPYFKIEDDYLKLVKRVRPKIIAVTAHDPKTAKKQEYAESVGGELKIASNFIKKFSTKRIIELCDSF